MQTDQRSQHMSQIEWSLEMRNRPLGENMCNAAFKFVVIKCRKFPKNKSCNLNR